MTDLVNIKYELPRALKIGSIEALGVVALSEVVRLKQMEQVVMGHLNIFLVKELEMSC